MPSVLKARSTLGVETRSGDPERIRSARRDLAAAKLEQYIARVVASAPDLTVDQRARIASLLAPGAIQ